jgi:hypothetical protein
MTAFFVPLSHRSDSTDSMDWVQNNKRVEVHTWVTNWEKIVMGAYSARKVVP